MQPRVGRALGVAVILLVAGSSAAQSTADVFLANLKRSLAADDRRAVASMVRYPITVFVVGIRIPFANAAALLESYDTIFTTQLKADLAGLTSAPALAPDGTMTAGPVTIQPVDGGFKITRIEVWSLDAAQPMPSATSQRPGTSSRAGLERVIVRAGRPAQLAGSLSPGQTRSYVLWVEKGQLLEVRIERVRERDIVLRVRARNTRAPIDARSAAGVRVWTGRVAASADYLIDIVRLAAAGESALPYMLSITVR